jgi:kynurenine formamidase
LIRLLSHPLSPETPAFPDCPRATFEPTSRIERGDVCNWVTITTQNHLSTHVDGPWHFNPNGRRITEIAPEEFFFESPCLLDLAKSDDELITEADLRPHAAEIAGADVLMIRSGFGRRWRSADPERYSQHGPGFAASAGEYLIREQPSLRAIVLDFISAASPTHAPEGHEFHRVMLGRRREDRYILIVEDARLDADLRREDLGLVILAPLLLQDQDGGPVTLFADSRRLA